MSTVGDAGDAISCLKIYGCLLFGITYFNLLEFNGLRITKISA